MNANFAKTGPKQKRMAVLAIRQTVRSKSQITS